MPALYKDTGYTLNHLVLDIGAGRIALPDIQRPFVWSSAKARDLFDSMYRGYPIGTIMLWETGVETGTRKIGDSEDRSPQYLIVDGQQRLTSLYAVLTGQRVLTKTFEKKHIRIGYRPSDETFEVTDAAIEKDPEFIPDITALWTDGRKRTVRQFLKRLDEVRDGGLTESDEDLLEDRLDRVHDLKEFRFQVIELAATADEEEVAEIFVRINSEGVKLNQADFILTLMSVHWEKGRRELESFSRAAVDSAVTGPSPRNPYIEPSPDQMLRAGVALAFRRARLQHVYSILRGKDLESGIVSVDRRIAQFETLAASQERALDLTHWHEFLKCLYAAGYRSKRMITSENTVLFSYALWLIGRIDFGLDLHALRAVISRWFFMAHTTGRYTSSPESQLESDLGRIRDLPAGDGQAFVTELDRIVTANFTNDYWEISLPNRLDTSSPRSPALFAYLAALSLLDAEVLFSDIKVRHLLDPTSVAPRAMERHHLFPKKYLATQGITATKQVNAIANMAFLDWAENAVISSSGPADYWSTMSSKVPSEKLKRQVYLHALPVGWEQLAYQEFLAKRRTLIARVVREGFATLWGSAPSPREATIEDVIAAGESQTTEFKSTARWNLHTMQADPKMEHVIVKTVCGFLNAEGGTLLIGVDDGGGVVGLQADFDTLGSKGNADGYELFLRQLLDVNLTVATAATVRISFETRGAQQICVVSVAASGKPVFAKPVKGSGWNAEEFWVRTGNATRQLHGDDMMEYREQHWG
ncbi:GmrSD restriction endonuclease domain-containing protein [Mycobacterium sp. NPDC050041]|uniref:GmrSD restriction endonuclease domain-containing protein n=1 Tax=Mycobacterium sp. NPDC050041 TaxID=3364293 RepID=UPI003C2D4B45